MTINWTRPGRCHVIVNRRLVYATLWLFSRRWHGCWGNNLTEAQNRRLVPCSV
jgi:hypothetical protein